MRRLNAPRPFLLSAIVSLFVLGPCLMAAAPAGPNAANAPDPDQAKRFEATIKTYNLSDLFRPTRDYPYDSALVPPTRLGMPPEGVAPGMYPGQYGPMGGGGGGGGGGFGGGGFGGAAPPANPEGPMTVPSLMDLIKELVDPDSWRDNGGVVGSMRLLGDLLIVQQTPENHQRIAQLLGMILEQAGPSRMVTVRADWVLLDGEQARELLKAKDDRAGPVLTADRDLPALFKAAGPGGHYRAQTTCFNRQTVHVASGRGRTLVTGLSPQVGTGVGLYHVDTSLVQTGVMLQVTPVLSHDGQSAVLDVYSVVSGGTSPPVAAGGTPPRGGAATRPAGGATSFGAVQGSGIGEVPPVDRINVVAQQLRTTLRAKLGTPTLVGGMTLEPGGESSDGKQLYLIVQVTASE